MGWLRQLFSRRRRYEELSESIREHLDEKTADLMDRGMTRDEAERAARREFGNVTLIEEHSREVWQWPTIESALGDIHFAFRQLAKSPSFTFTAVLSLSLAIGACTAAYSLIDALILRPLPVPDPSKLVYCSYVVLGHPLNEETFINEALFDRLLLASGSNVDLFGVRLTGPVAFGAGTLPRVSFSDSGGEDEEVGAQWISGDGFRILGIRPALGRVLTGSDDRRNTAVLSYSFWMRRFKASPTVLGRWFTYWGQQYQIVGVAQKGFDGLAPGRRIEMWFPKMNVTSESPYSGWDQVWGRVKPAVAVDQARQALQVAFTNYLSDHADEFFTAGVPSDQLPQYKNARLRLRSGATGAPSIVRIDFERPLWIVSVVVALVLLIACVNVANLLLARAATREREIALRISIGASRARLIQQLLIESGLLAGVASILGLAIASATAPSIVGLLSPSDNPAYLDLQIGWRLLAFVSFICVATSLLFGLAPAHRASAVSPYEALKVVGAKQSGRIGLLRPLLGLQVGFGFAVLFVGGLLLLSFYKITSVDLGFSKDCIVLFNIGINDSTKEQQARIIASQMLDHIRRIPGVQAAAMSEQGLIGGDFAPVERLGIRFPGREPESLKPRDLAVSPGFFETMQIPLLEGRDLTASDRTPQLTAVVVNRAFVRQYLQDENPLGKRFETTGNDPHPIPNEIVGVVQDAKIDSLREPNSPTFYDPWPLPAGTLEVRTAGNPLALVPTIRRAINRVNPAVQAYGVTSESERINNTLLRERLLAFLAGFFAVVTVVLTAIGLYGVLNYSVVRRTKEIGIRMALGASRFGVVRLVISEVLLVVAVGLGIGIGGGFALCRFVATLLFEVKPSDFWSLVSPIACFLLGSALAALPPTLRSARIDPIVSLREE
jgi:predicted permease